MVKNVRWLYNKLGTVDISSTGSNTISGGISAVQNNIDGKANASHTHGVGDLPVSNSSVNSTSYVPSSAVVYSLKNTISDLSADIETIQDQLDPNKRYESKNLGTWSSATDISTFLSRFNHDNLYKDGDTELSIGNYVTIAYNSREWVIAGFDCEHNQTAADGTVYDNGYGICLVPKTAIKYQAPWAYSNTITGAYKSSYMHRTILPELATDMDNVLGSNIVNRNVLLSTSVDSNNHANSYSWTNAKFTLMSVCQLTGTSASHHTKYDDGEANYKLPLFNYESCNTGRYYWLRNIHGTFPTNTSAYTAFCISNSGSIDYNNVTGGLDLRPMIYIR